MRYNLSDIASIPVPILAPRGSTVAVTASAMTKHSPFDSVIVRIVVVCPSKTLKMQHQTAVTESETQKTVG